MRRDALLIGLVLVALLLGAWLRTNGAERRWVWQDETVTLMHVAGRTGPDVDASRPTTFGALAATARDPAPGGPARVTTALAEEDAQHPPLYYLGQRYWNDAGGAALGRRSFSIAMGALAVLAIAWFAFVLGGARAAAFAFAFAAVSPFLVLYGQQMREYGLWCAFIAASSALLVLAAKADSKARSIALWAAYAAATAGALWTSPLSLLLAPAHAIYAVYAGGPRRILQFALAYAVALLAFAPWAAIIYAKRTQIAAENAWSATPYSPLALAAKLLFTAASAFTDLAYANRIGVVAGAIALLAAAAAAVFLARKERAAAVALGAIAVSTALLPFVADIVSGTHRSSSSRYLCPLVIAIVVAVACALARAPRRFGVAAGAALVLLAAFSSALGTSSPVWWDNHGDSGTIAVATSLSRAGDPPVLYEGPCAGVLGLALISVAAEPLRCGPTAAGAIPTAGTYVISPSAALEERARAAKLRVVPVTVGRDASDAVRAFRGDTGSGGADQVLARIERIP